MQERETGTKGSYVKRVSVRTGGAGHAHSGVVNSGSAANLVGNESLELAKAGAAGNGKIVRLGT